MRIDYQHFLFDLDGTLVNSINEIYLAAKKICNKYHLQIPKFEYFKTRVGIHPSAFFYDHGARNNIEQLIEEFREILFNEAGDKSLVFEGAHELLRILKKNNYRISLATTKPTLLAKTLLKRYGLDIYFSYIQGTEDSIRPKPAPDMIIKCISKAKNLKAVMIGDTSNDIKAANSAGIDGIGVCTGAHDREKLETTSAKLVVNNLNELLNHL